VPEKREAALQAAADVRVGALPRAIGRQRPEARQPVAIRELLDQDSGERRRGLADRKPRMPAALEQDHPQAELPGDHRED
jgi:hypothetical protein